MGERAISPMGHVRMMAAVQPALSGAISKTVNLPESATIDDVEDLLRGLEAGLKALAIYRDNCKVGQPLSVARRSRPKCGPGRGRVPRCARSAAACPSGAPPP
jgi:ribonucleoside-diphosphate reductase alpha chain